MSQFDVIAVGAPPTFRQQVARALDQDPAEVEWMPSVTAVEALLAEGNGRASVVALSPAVKDVDAFGLAEFVTRRAPATAVVLVRERPMDGLLPAAMRAGVRDVVNLSLGSQELKEALERAIAWSANVRSLRPNASATEPAEHGVVVSLFSSKGGTGKTFIACNLAVALAERSGLDCAVLDYDLEMGDVFSYFGAESRQTIDDLLSMGNATDREPVLAGGRKLSDRLWGYAGVWDPGASSSVSGEAAGKVLRTLRANFAYTVVDASGGYSDHVLAAFDLSDVICLITSLDVVGVRHLSSALQMLQSLGLPRERFLVVLNRADSKVGLGPEEVERVSKIRVDAKIPSSRLVPISLNRGRPVCIEERKSEVAKSIVALADKLMVLAPVPVLSGMGSDPASARRAFATGGRHVTG
jgi:pilus assembly protein CpaE